jgi:D-glycero-D-manno-heptose 1,7-bisphosphate phosphatase
MMKLLSEKGGRIDAVFFCPHAATEQCECRKPAPGLMHDIGERYGVELDTVPMVCDTLRDLEAAKAAGCRPHLVRSGRAAEADDATIAQWLQAVPGSVVHADLSAFAEHLIAH